MCIKELHYFEQDCGGVMCKEEPLCTGYAKLLNTDKILGHIYPRTQLEPPEEFY